MKKICVMLIATVMAMALASCGAGDGQPATEEKETAQAAVAPKSVDSEEELSETVVGNVEAAVEALNKDFEKLASEVDTYEKFVKNVDRVEKFYGQIYDEAVGLGFMMKECSAACAEAILSSSKSHEDKYDDFEMLYDCIYEDAGDAVYDGIYEGVLEDMYEAYYDGILDDGYDVAPYDDWLDTTSDEYDRWLDTSSDVYDAWLDSQSDIYDFLLDVRGEVFDGDMEKADEILEEFRAETAEQKEAAASE